MKLIMLMFILLTMTMTNVYSEERVDRFEGDLIVKFLTDETNVIVQKAFKYIDPNGFEWSVPSGTKTDGASVPRLAWSAFPPFSGLYIRAAVVHDQYCVTQERPWRAVHRMFYDAMLTAGVKEMTAKTMYGAVYTFGPRWKLNDTTKSIENISLSAEEQLLNNDKLKAWIRDSNPSIMDIEKFVNQKRLRQFRG